MGQDAAHEHNLMALNGKIAMSISPDSCDAASTYGAVIESITRTMGAEFVQRFEASLQAKVEALAADAGPMLIPSPGRLKFD